MPLIADNSRTAPLIAQPAENTTLFFHVITTDTIPVFLDAKWSLVISSVSKFLHLAA
jgi:hypothetical protein